MQKVCTFFLCKEFTPAQFALRWGTKPPKSPSGGLYLTVAFTGDKSP